MDDRDLEARLSAHLHRRFGDAPPPEDLARSVRQALRTQPRRLNLGALGVRSPMSLGLSLTAAAVAVMVVAVAASSLGLHLVPGPGGQPTPTPITGPAQRVFIVLPPSTTVPPKAVSAVASDVLTARLTALGVGNFITATANGITFTLPTAGPSDDDVRAVLAAPGIVQFIPIPAGDPTVTAGQALPGAYPALFGSDGVATIRDDADQNGNPALTLILAPAASRLFADYTTNHIGEQLAIVVDGKVASAPVIQSAIVGGTVQITNASSSTGVTLGGQLRAVLIGGPLPEAWRGAPVVSMIPKTTAEVIAIREAGTTATVISSEPNVFLLGIGRWTAVWNVVLAGEFPASCPSAGGLGSTCGPTVTTELIVLDGATGGFVQSEAPAP